MNVRVKILTLNVAVIRGQMNLQNTIGKSTPPRRNALTGKDSSMSVKSDIDKLKIRMSFTDFRFFVLKTRRTREFPVTPRTNVNTYKPSLMCFSVSVTVVKFVGFPIDALVDQVAPEIVVKI